VRFYDNIVPCAVLYGPSYNNSVDIVGEVQDGSTWSHPLTHAVTTAGDRAEQSRAEQRRGSKNRRRRAEKNMKQKQTEQSKNRRNRKKCRGAGQEQNLEQRQGAEQSRTEQGMETEQSRAEQGKSRTGHVKQSRTWQETEQNRQEWEQRQSWGKGGAVYVGQVGQTEQAERRKILIARLRVAGLTLLLNHAIIH
jgi:hypothetical protein